MPDFKQQQALTHDGCRALQGAPVQVPLPVHLVLLTEQTPRPRLAHCLQKPSLQPPSAGSVRAVLFLALLKAICKENARPPSCCPLQAASTRCPDSQSLFSVISTTMTLHGSSRPGLRRLLRRGWPHGSTPSPPAVQSHWAALLLPLQLTLGLWPRTGSAHTGLTALHPPQHHL